MIDDGLLILLGPNDQDGISAGDAGVGGGAKRHDVSPVDAAVNANDRATVPVGPPGNRAGFAYDVGHNVRAARVLPSLPDVAGHEIEAGARVFLDTRQIFRDAKGFPVRDKNIEYPENQDQAQYQGHQNSTRVKPA